ncbi:unnamed protein product [Clonostachys rhizophaga]|uniref:Uncharacterized protein n=1 Tax=Clonostachys rhizophaga TaxID=160324 RepID=A0A9N9VRP3_9HYPO|nr:unnamed protein product [Clonostachys rhizophaga]
MIIDQVNQYCMAYLVLVVIGLFVTKLLANKYANGLNQVPGPRCEIVSQGSLKIGSRCNTDNLWTRLQLHKVRLLVRHSPKWNHSGGSKLKFHITVQQTINKSRVPLLTIFTS